MGREAESITSVKEKNGEGRSEIVVLPFQRHISRNTKFIRSIILADIIVMPKYA